MNFLYLIFLPALSGLLTQISLAPVHLYLGAFFALIPLFISLNNIMTLKGRLLTALMTGFFANIFGFYWMILVFQNFFSYSFNQSIGLFFIYCFVGQLQFIIFAILFHFLTKNKYFKLNLKSDTIKIIGFSVLYTLADFLTPKLFGDTLGNAFDNQAQLRQLSKFFGLLFLTFICSLSSYSIITDVKNKKVKYTLLSALLVLICIFFGNIENQKQINLIDSTKEHIKVAVIQPNTLGEDKIKAERGISTSKKDNLNILLSMSKEALTKDKSIDLIVWPETSYPSFFTNPLNKEDVELNNLLKSFILENHTSILFGLTDRDFDGKRYNSVILIQEGSNGIKFEVYHKVILAFMGEYNPFARKTTSSLQIGDHPVILTLKTKNNKLIKISPIVCYEALSSLYVSKAKKLNPDVIIHISNESWFGYFGLPQSFLALSAFRAIESSVPMIKAANSGLSALILPNGDIKYLGKLNVKEIKIMDVPIIQN